VGPALGHNESVSETKSAVVTGASSGIGAATARRLADAGFHVFCAARRRDRIEQLADDIGGTPVECDVTSEDSVAGLAEAVGPRLDVLVNNAGGAFGSTPVAEAVSEEWRRMYEVNVIGLMQVTRALLPALVASGAGAILNVGSTAGYQPLPRQATYSATKAFANSFTDALYADLGGTGVSVTSLRPGPVETEFGETAGMGEEFSSLPSFAIDSAADVAKAAVEGMERGKRVVGPGVVGRLAVAGQYAPRGLLLPALRRFYPVK
jgi:short-subunit dehydrogenase